MTDDKQETAVATTQHTALEIRSGQTFWTPEQLAALAQLGVENAPNGDLAVFLHYAQRTGLDPFSRQLYMLPRQQNVQDGNGQWRRQTRWTIQAGIDALRIVAQRSGEYAGQVGPEWCGADGKWVDVWLSEQPPAAARVGVLRRGFAAPLYAVAIFREYAGTKPNGELTQMWATKGALMIAKCAEALALRKAFPMDLSGIYTAEEMAAADSVTDGPAPLAPTGQSVDETTCSASAERVAELREQVLRATETDDVESTLRAIWQEAKQDGALACTVSVPEGWREHANVDECTLGELVVGARGAWQAQLPHGELLVTSDVIEGEVVDSETTASDGEYVDAEPCWNEARDGRKCIADKGHNGRHVYPSQQQ